MGKRKQDVQPHVKSSSLEKLLIGGSLLLILCGIITLFLLAPAEPSEHKSESDEIEPFVTDLVVEIRQKIQKTGEQQKNEKFELYKNLFDLGTQNFTPQDLEWMVASGDIQMIARAGAVFAENGETDRAIKEFEFVIKNSNKGSILDVAYDKLSQIYIAQRNNDKAIATLKAATETNSISHLNRWYGFWLERLLEQNNLEEVDRVVVECLERFRKIPNLVPFHCFHQAGMLAMFEGDLSSSRNYFFRLYRETLQSWKDEEGNSCPAVFVPLAVDTPHGAITKLSNEVLVNSNLVLSPNANYTKNECSKQKYPLYLTPAENIDGKYTKTLEEYKTSFSRMGCFSKDEKRAVLHKIEDATVVGAFKIITRKINEGECIQYTSGFPYLNSLAQPRFHGMSHNYLDLPIKEFDNVLILHFLDTNYFHFTVEGISKVILAMQHEEFKDIENLRILADPSNIAVQYFNMLNVLPMAEMYQPDKYRYHIKNLYIIDWKFVAEVSTDPTGLSLRQKHQHFEDYYLPPIDILQYTRAALQSLISEDLYWEPRDTIIFLHRKGIRSVTNPLPLYKSLSYIANAHGLKFLLHGVHDDDPISAQIDLFSRAVVVMGIHGAGFTNMIYCKPKTAIIELPVIPEKVSVFSRMASAFDFPYYTIPRTAFYHFHSIDAFTPRMLGDTGDTLFQALADLGYAY